jgi:hypothetical protein
VSGTTPGRDVRWTDDYSGDAVDVTSYKWLVGTDKDLKESDVFFLAYYQEGRTSPNMQTRHFNLKAREPGSRPPAPSTTRSDDEPTFRPFPESSVPGAELTNRPQPTSATTTSQSPTSSSTDTPINTSTNLSIAPSNSTSSSDNKSSTPTSNAQPSSSPSDTPSSPDPPRITIAAIVGICVGVLVFLLLVLLTIYLCLRRRRALASAASSQHSLTQDDGYYRPNLHEAPCRSPKEMGQLPGLWKTHPELPIRSPGELGSNGELWTGRPELPNLIKSPAELGDNKGLWTGRPELPGDRHASVHTVRYELES